MRAALFSILLTLPVSALGQDGEFFTLKGHGGPIMDITVSPSGQIATASFDNAVGVWNGTQPRWMDGHRAAVNTIIFTDDTNAISAGDDFAVAFWNFETGQSAIKNGHKGKVMALAQRADGITASASWDGSIGIWKDQTISTYLEGHSARVNDVVFLGDGSLVSASADGTIRLFSKDFENSRILLNHGFGVNRLAFNAATGWLAYGSVDGATRIVDPVNGDKIADFTLDRRPILAMALSPDGTRLAVGDGEGFIMVINTEEWRIERDFRAAQRGPIWALAFSSDGKNVHAGGLDNVVYSWPLESMDAHGQMSTEERTFHEDPATLSNGERQFKRKCSICHTLTESSGRRAGPTLYQLFGRRAGTISDYRYSSILTDSPIVWDETSINALFEEGPDHYIPGSKMPMQRINAADDRRDLIDYLKGATAPEEN